MPAAAFKDLWSTLHNHKSWLGLVKNRSKNGDHYYVSAFATPIIKDGNISEVQSVRTKPSPEVIQRANKIYPQLAQGITPRVLKEPIFTLTSKLLLLQLFIFLSLTLSVFIYPSSSVITTALAGLVIMLSSAYMLTPFRKLVSKAKAIN